MDKPKLQLLGLDGNAFSILGRARQAWSRSGNDMDEWKKIHDEATSGNYDHLLQTMMEHFDTDGDEDDEDDE